MYKIFIKFKTSNDMLNLYECYMEENEDGELVEYVAHTIEEAEVKVYELSKSVMIDSIRVLKETRVTYDVNVTE